jgi:hypothetical protein
MFGLSKRERQAKRVIEITNLAGDCQMEICITAKRVLEPHYGDQSVAIAAAVANYIMHFGMIAGDHYRDPIIRSALQTELENANHTFTREFRQNILGTLILFAAIERRPIESFRAHLRNLAEFKFFELGSETPDVSGLLGPDELVYLFTATTIKL